MDGARSPAPDLFTALAWGSRLAPEQADEPPVSPERETAPELPVIGGPSPRKRGTAVIVDPSIAAVTVEPGKPGFTPLADLLEPGAVAAQPLDATEFEDLSEVFDETNDVGAMMLEEIASPSAPAAAAPLPATPTAKTQLPRPPTRRPTPVAFPRPRGPEVPIVERRPASAAMFPAPGDAADSAEFTADMSASVPMVSRVAPLVEVDLDEPVRSRSGAWAWIALSLMLAGALGWVLYTQTDLFAGDVIAKRDAEAVASAEAELAEKKAAQEAKKSEYGTIQVDSTPVGARVFDVRKGPEARFEALPVAHEYMVLVTAPGHVPRVRTVKGSELSAPVVVDLDPPAPGAKVPPIPEAPPPRLADAPGQELATLVLRSNTKDAELALLVGYTPGARLLDVDVEAPRELWVVLAGHQPAELTVKGRHYEDDADGTPFYATNVTLVPVSADDEDEAEIELSPGDPGAGAASSVPPPPAAAAATPAPAKATPKKKKKKKKRRR